MIEKIYQYKSKENSINDLTFLFIKQDESVSEYFGSGMIRTHDIITTGTLSGYEVIYDKDSTVSY